jgi:Kef-type K+ transport system membrane component KefB
VEHDLSRVLIILGVLFLLGLLTDLIGRRTPLPRVTLLIGFGFLIGPSALGFLPPESREWFPIVAKLALVMVGFLLGESLSLAQLRRRGRAIVLIAGSKVMVTFVVVGGGLILAGFGTTLSLLLAAITTATDPAATADAVREQHAEGEFTETLLGVVALDDAWGLILFSLTLAMIESFSGVGNGASGLLFGVRELGGALLLGLAIGIPTALVTGRVDPGEPTLIEALGTVFLCGGLALRFHVSFLLAAIVMGATVASLARHHRRPFNAIEGIEWPFMIVFFVLAGASIETEAVSAAGALVLAYILFRVAGTVLGAGIGCAWTDRDAPTRRWLGVALLPQAGVALGMALVAAERFPELAGGLVPVSIATTAFFELIGPILTRLALQRTSAA